MIANKTLLFCNLMDKNSNRIFFSLLNNLYTYINELNTDSVNNYMQVGVDKIDGKPKDPYVAVKIKGKKIFNSLYSKERNCKLLSTEILIY